MWYSAWTLLPAVSLSTTGRCDCWLGNFQYLVSFYAGECLRFAAGPGDFDFGNHANRTQPEGHAPIGGRSVADGSRHFAILIPNTNAGADAVAIRFRSVRADDNPVAGSGADVLP